MVILDFQQCIPTFRLTTILHKKNLKCLSQIGQCLCGTLVKRTECHHRIIHRNDYGYVYLLAQTSIIGRQATFSSDILYDTLRKYDPDHLLLQVTREEAERGLVDFSRIEDMLSRVEGRIDLIRLPRVTPLAAPLFLEPGRIPVHGTGRERMLEEAAMRLMAEAGLA